MHSFASEPAAGGGEGAQKASRLLQGEFMEVRPRIICGSALTEVAYKFLFELNARLYDSMCREALSEISKDLRLALVVERISISYAKLGR